MNAATMQLMNATAAAATTMLMCEPLHVKLAKLFYKKTAVELVFISADQAAAAFKSSSPSTVMMLSVKRAPVFGGEISIALDASIQPVRLMWSAKDAAQCKFSLVYGVDSKTLRIRAPSAQAYDEWTSAICLALNGSAATVNKVAIAIASSINNTDSIPVIKIGLDADKSSSSSSISGACSSITETDLSAYSSDCNSTGDFSITTTTTSTSSTTQQLASRNSSVSVTSSSSSLTSEVELLLSVVSELDQWTSRTREERLGLQTPTTKQEEHQANHQDTTHVQSQWV